MTATVRNFWGAGSGMNRSKAPSADAGVMVDMKRATPAGRRMRIQSPILTRIPGKLQSRRGNAGPLRPVLNVQNHERREKHGNDDQGKRDHVVNSGKIKKNGTADDADTRG